jgi:polyhydroxyalkanoate synthesis repressor PhaR
MAKLARVVIKKYGNRRLYNTLASRYVNLDDLAALVRNGTELQVVDAKTGEDLTRATLAQIIMEEAKDGSGGFPVELLKQLILASDKIRRDFMMWYLKSAFDNYQKVQSTLQSGLAQLGSVALSPIEAIRHIVQGAPVESHREDDELSQLRNRVAELEQELKKRAPRPKKKKLRHT